MSSYTGSGTFSSTDAANEGAGSVAVDTNSTAVVAARTARAELTIVNDSAVVVYLGLGETAVVNKGIRLAASGGSYTTGAWLGAVNAVAASGSGNVVCYADLG